MGGPMTAGSREPVSNAHPPRRHIRWAMTITTIITGTTTTTETRSHHHDHDVEEALEEALELDTQSQIFLEMRRQNLDLLRIATEVAGYTGEHGPLKPGDLRTP